MQGTVDTIKKSELKENRQRTNSKAQKLRTAYQTYENDPKIQQRKRDGEKKTESQASGYHKILKL